MSWGQAGAQEYPQIFHPQWARDWYAVKRWSIDSGVEVLDFVGTMSECGASPCPQQEQGETFTFQQCYLAPGDSIARFRPSR